jgi:hypothetical protein
VSANCPFHFAENPRPSIFAGDSKFTAYSNGKTRSQVMSETTDRITKATGKNPGTLDLSPNSVGRAGFPATVRKKRG